MNALLMRLIQAALNNLVLPAGIQPAQVMIRMPANGWPAMPFINVNLERIEQTETAIGENIQNPTPDNVWTIFVMAKRTWRLTVTTPTAEERDFYRDTLLSVLRIIDATVFYALGLNVTHAVQAASYPLARERDGQVPGFYCADIILCTDGNFSTSINTAFPVILGISANPLYLSPAFNIGPIA